MRSIVGIYSFLFVLLSYLTPTEAVAYDLIDGNQIIVSDGNTVILPCPIVGIRCSERVRLKYVEVPSISRPDCDEGLRRGLKAKARLAELIRGHQIYVDRGKGEHDRDGRTLASLHIGTPSGINVGSALLNEGLARVYKSGETKEARRDYWCRAAEK